MKSIKINRLLKNGRLEVKSAKTMAARNQGNLPTSSGYKRDVRGLFSIAAFCTYSWSIVIFFWDIPFFLLRYSTKNIIINWATVSLSLNALVATQIVIGLWAFTLIVLPVGFVIGSKKEKVKQIINKLIENLSILVSLYGFLSVIGTLIVIIRNVF